MTMKGGETPMHWAALAPHIENPKRESIVEAIRWIGPLAPPDLQVVLDDPEFHLANIAYHVTALAADGVLTDIGRRSAGGSIEKLYYFPTP